MQNLPCQVHRVGKLQVTARRYAVKTFSWTSMASLLAQQKSARAREMVKTLFETTANNLCECKQGWEPQLNVSHWNRHDRMVVVHFVRYYLTD